MIHYLLLERNGAHVWHTLGAVKKRFHAPLHREHPSKQKNSFTTCHSVNPTADAQRHCFKTPMLVTLFKLKGYVVMTQIYTINNAVLSFESRMQNRRCFFGFWWPFNEIPHVISLTGINQWTSNLYYKCIQSTLQPHHCILIVETMVISRIFSLGPNFSNKDIYHEREKLNPCATQNLSNNADLQRWPKTSLLEANGAAMHGGRWISRGTWSLGLIIQWGLPPILGPLGTARTCKSQHMPAYQTVTNSFRWHVTFDASLHKTTLTTRPGKGWCKDQQRRNSGCSLKPCFNQFDAIDWCRSGWHDKLVNLRWALM